MYNAALQTNYFLLQHLLSAIKISLKQFSLFALSNIQVRGSTIPYKMSEMKEHRKPYYVNGPIENDFYFYLHTI